MPAAAFSRDAKSDDEMKIILTILECRNQEVDNANESENAKLLGEVHTFQSRDRGVSESHKAQLKHCQAPEKYMGVLHCSGELSC